MKRTQRPAEVRIIGGGRRLMRTMSIDAEVSR